MTLPLNFLLIYYFVSFAINHLKFLELYRTQHIKAYIIVEISAMSACVSIIHNKFSQKRLKAVRADVFERTERSVISNIKKVLCFQSKF